MTPELSVTDIPKKRAVRRVWIVFKLHLAGSSLSAIAREQGVTVQSVSEALDGRSARLQQAIADTLGLPIEKLFPECFGSDGARRPAPPPERSTRRRSRKPAQEVA